MGLSGAWGFGIGTGRGGRAGLDVCSSVGNGGDGGGGAFVLEFEVNGRANDAVDVGEHSLNGFQD